MMRAKFTNLVDECRQMVVSHLMPNFSNLFENADVVLLEFAEKAESNAAQQRFFEAMKEIRVKRATMEQVFLDELRRHFQVFKNSSQAGATTDGIVVSEEGDDFVLVDKDAHEESVALQNMTSKAHLNYANEMHAMRQRLALLVGGRKLDQEQVPGGPRQLGECFRVAVRQLTLDPKIRIVLFVLFDKFVMSQLADLYHEYNSRLLAAGLLPHLKYEIRKAADVGVNVPRSHSVMRGDASCPVTTSARAENRGRKTVGEETFDAICQLLAGRHNVSMRKDGVVSDVRQESMSRPMLVSAIHEMQHADRESVVSRDTLDDQLIPEIQLDTRLIDSIKLTLVQQREKLFGGVDRRRVASADADVIDLVGMIFEYMLNDEAIPNAVKALLSRLHTPFLKVAILDKQFFTQEDHPVRQLLNTLADAGARYVVENDLKRGIFPYMRASVNRILDEFDDQLSIFAEVLAEFEVRLEQLRHTAEVTEQRSREAASGQERLQQSRERAREIIGAAMEGRKLSPAIDQLLRQVWANKLMFILLRDRDGEQSPFWELALRLMEDIIESTDLCADEQALQELRARLPGLQISLREGLDRLASFGNDDSGQLYNLIVDSQCAALDPPRTEAGTVAMTGEPLLQIMERHERDPAGTGAEGIADTPPSPREEVMLRQLAKVEFGTWFEFAATGSQSSRRLKLAWYGQKTGNYMFVDKLGVKAAAITRMELVRGMAAGRTRILDQQRAPFVDRAMEAVRNLLRRGEKISA